METRHCNDFGFQPSLQDSDILADLPGTEVAGYFQTAAPAARAKKQVLRGAPSQGSVARLRMTNLTIEILTPDTRTTDYRFYCAAFTSFQISLYLARRGTFCQK